MTDEHRKMRLELLQKLYGKLCEITPINDGTLIARAEYHHEDEKYYGMQSMNMWGLQDHEYVFIFSGNRLDSEAYEQAMERSQKESEGKLKPDRKLRSATLTTLLIYDDADEDVKQKILKHDDKTYHKMSLNGWSIHRVAAVLTDSGDVVHDKRSTNLERRLKRISEL